MIVSFSCTLTTLYGYGHALKPAGAACKPRILLSQPRFFHSTVLGPHLGLQGRLLCPVFCFYSQQFPFYGYGAAIMPAGVTKKPSISLLNPSFFPFYGYRAAIRPAGAAIKPSISHLYQVFSILRLLSRD